MISFLTSPKAFEGLAAHQQRTAIRSWLASTDGAEVILYGDSPGTSDAAKELGVGHVRDVEVSTTGTPLFGAIAKHASQLARYEVQVYVNADILLGRDLVGAVHDLPGTHFLAVGQRVDLAEGEEFVGARSGRPECLADLAKAGRATLHDPGGSDYFVFRRGMWGSLGPVAIGRGGYDNALIAYCIRQGIPVFDTTLRILAVHQFHGYGHVTGGADTVFRGEEARRNLEGTFGQGGLALPDADWLMTSTGIRRNRGRGDVLRHLETRLRLRYRHATLAEIVRHASRIRGRLFPPVRWTPSLADVLLEHEIIAGRGPRAAAGLIGDDE